MAHVQEKAPVHPREWGPGSKLLGVLAGANADDVHEKQLAAWRTKSGVEMAQRRALQEENADLLARQQDDAARQMQSIRLERLMNEERALRFAAPGGVGPPRPDPNLPPPRSQQDADEDERVKKLWPHLNDAGRKGVLAEYGQRREAKAMDETRQAVVDAGSKAIIGFQNLQAQYGTDTSLSVEALQALMEAIPTAKTPAQLGQLRREIASKTSQLQGTTSKAIAEVQTVAKVKAYAARALGANPGNIGNAKLQSAIEVGLDGGWMTVDEAGDLIRDAELGKQGPPSAEKLAQRGGSTVDLVRTPEGRSARAFMEEEWTGAAMAEFKSIWGTQGEAEDRDAALRRYEAKHAQRVLAKYKWIHPPGTGPQQGGAPAVAAETGGGGGLKVGLDTVKDAMGAVGDFAGKYTLQGQVANRVAGGIAALRDKMVGKEDHPLAEKAKLYIDIAESIEANGLTAEDAKKNLTQAGITPAEVKEMQAAGLLPED